jgi:hypothetical protein
MLAGTFGVDCDWKSMGIKPFAIPPRPQFYYDGVRFFFSTPVYSADGTQAELTYGLSGDASARNYFFAQYDCIAMKANGRWTAQCRLGVIT